MLSTTVSQILQEIKVMRKAKKGEVHLRGSYNILIKQNGVDYLTLKDKLREVMLDYARSTKQNPFEPSDISEVEITIDRVLE
jgi:hypothetical protein